MYFILFIYFLLVRDWFEVCPVGKQPGGCWGVQGVFKNFPSAEFTAGGCGAGCTGETCFSCRTLNVSTFFPVEPDMLAGDERVCAGQVGTPSSTGVGQQHLEGYGRLALANLHPGLSRLLRASPWLRVGVNSQFKA